MPFDLDQMMNTPVADATSTKFTVVPEGEYLFRVDDLPAGGMNAWVRTAKFSEREVPELSLPCIILNDDIRQKLGRDKIIVPYKILLDMDGNALAIGEGKNVKLGKLKDALGQNVPGWTFSQLAGAGPFKGITKNRPDKNDPDTVYPEIQRVARQ